MSQDQRSPRQILNEFVAIRAFERGEAIAHHYPNEVYLQVASACNLDCYMCYEHLRPEGAKRGRDLVCLAPEIFAELEREVLPNASKVTFGLGGEPMLSPHLLDYIERSHALGLHVHLMTNGTRIGTEKSAETLARCLRSMEISADGATQETYERIRKGASFQHLIGNIERLNTYRLNSPPEERTHLTMCMVLMQSNVHELPQYVELAHRLQVNRVAAWHVIPVTEAGKAESLFYHQELADRWLAEGRAKAEELGIDVDMVRSFSEDTESPEAPASTRQEVIAKMQELDQSALLEEEAWSRPLLGSAPSDAGAEVEPPTGRKPGARLHCPMPTVSLFVFYDGRVFPCCHPHVHTKMPMGDLTKQSFKEIWNGRNYRNLRAGLTRGEAPPLCERCSIIHSPPTVYEDPAVLDDEGADLATWYAGRDLEPLEDGLPTLDLVAKATRAEIADHLVKSRAHVEAIENDRRGLRGHAEALESERRDLRAHVGALESERRDLRAHVEAIGSERRGLRAHSETLERDRRGLRAHSETLERDRRGLRAHAETLERDRRGLRAHVEALESERETMRSHIESLERILTRIHGIPIYRALCRVKDCILPRGKGSRQAD